MTEKLEDATNEKVPEKKDTKKAFGKKSKIVVNPIMADPHAKFRAVFAESCVITYGRMNPPTKGHEALVDKVISIAEELEAVPLVFLSKTQDNNKNPIVFETKIDLARRAFGSCIQESSGIHLVDTVKLLNGKYKHLTFVAGSDRIDEYTILLNKYNNKEYCFESISVVSAGHRDPDGQGVEQSSGTSMREYVRTGNIVEFTDGLPEKLQKHAKIIFEQVSNGLGIVAQVTYHENNSLIEHIQTVYQEMQVVITEKEQQALRVKATRSNISEDILEIVFKRGVHCWTEGISTKQQAGFTRVNSFIAKGKNYFNEDRDLVEWDDLVSADEDIPFHQVQPGDPKVSKVKVLTGKDAETAV
jgi:hypothetical protein